MGALNQKNKVATDTFHKCGQHFTITKSLDIDFAGLAAVSFTYLSGKMLRPGSGKDFSRRHG
jgi:hypothetical protein